MGLWRGVLAGPPKPGGAGRVSARAPAPSNLCVWSPPMVEGVDALHRVDMWMEACTLFVELNEGPPGGTGAFFYALYSLQSV